MEDDLFKTMREVIAPFVSPRSTTRSEGYNPPEDDRLTIEVKVGDWWKLCVLAGTLDGEYLRNLQQIARPSNRFLTEIDRLAEKTETAVEGAGPGKPGG